MIAYDVDCCMDNGDEFEQWAEEVERAANTPPPHPKAATVYSGDNAIFNGSTFVKHVKACCGFCPNSWWEHVWRLPDGREITDHRECSPCFRAAHYD